MSGDVCSGGCGAGVRRLITEAGKVRELDTLAHPHGNHVIVTTGAGHVRAHVLRAGEYPEGDAFRVHQCPPPPPPGLPCQFRCGYPMPRELVVTYRGRRHVEVWTHHPCCDPDYRKEAGMQAAARARPD